MFSVHTGQYGHCKFQKIPAYEPLGTKTVCLIVCSDKIFINESSLDILSSVA